MDFSINITKSENDFVRCMDSMQNKVMNNELKDIRKYLFGF